MDFTVQRNRYLSTKTNFVPRIHSDVFYFCIFASVRVTRTSKAMQTTAIRTVANSLPENEVILLTLLISKRYIPYTDLRKIFGITAIRKCNVFKRYEPPFIFRRYSSSADGTAEPSVPPVSGELLRRGNAILCYAVLCYAMCTKCYILSLKCYIYAA